ncbi:hypothetical protein Goarm_009853, partial [Gossypium armourianum]|nr:hypothetical protein [Gossypium armourianum]
MRTGWADGPEFVTQCPIRPGGSCTYRFTIQGQEGTLWWHAHSSWLRATVYGALIIRPRLGESYPFPKPNLETPIVLGEWWDANRIDVVREATRTGATPNVSDAYTINAQPGDLYKCSSKDTTIIPIDAGETNLLRVINAALNQPLFFAVANHTLTVVGADATYIKPFTTSVLMLAYNDTNTVTAYNRSFRSPRNVQVPTEIDESLFFTVGLGLNNCPPNFRRSRCQGPNGTRLAASMNNVSFMLPRSISLLQAHQQGIPG